MARPLADQEKALLSLMLKDSHSETIDTENLFVEDLADGGMGSIRVKSEHQPRHPVPFATAEFKDADNVIISVQINMDRNGELYEIDIWKTDFTPVIQYPQLENLIVTKLWDSH